MCMIRVRPLKHALYCVAVDSNLNKQFRAGQDSQFKKDNVSLNVFTCL